MIDRCSDLLKPCASHSEIDVDWSAIEGKKSVLRIPHQTCNEQGSWDCAYEAVVAATDGMHSAMRKVLDLERYKQRKWAHQELLTPPPIVSGEQVTINQRCESPISS